MAETSHNFCVFKRAANWNGSPIGKKIKEDNRGKEHEIRSLAAQIVILSIHSHDFCNPLPFSNLNSTPGTRQALLGGPNNNSDSDNNSSHRNLKEAPLCTQKGLMLIIGKSQSNMRTHLCSLFRTYAPNTLWGKLQVDTQQLLFSINYKGRIAFVECLFSPREESGSYQHGYY